MGLRAYSIAWLYGGEISLLFWWMRLALVWCMGILFEYLGVYCYYIMVTLRGCCYDAGVLLVEESLRVSSAVDGED